jgi:hypothetical protein
VEEVEDEETAAAEALAAIGDTEANENGTVLAAHGSKKKRIQRSHLEAGIKVVELNVKRKRAQEVVDILEEKGGENVTPAEKRKLAGKVGVLAKLDGELNGAQGRLVDLEATEQAKQAKAKKKQDSADAKKHVSEADVIMLCVIRLKYQSKFDNTSDKTDAAPEAHHEGVQRSCGVWRPARRRCNKWRVGRGPCACRQQQQQRPPRHQERGRAHFAAGQTFLGATQPQTRLEGVVGGE